MGEVVVVYDEHCPHSLWKLGRVTELITGNDGQVGGAVVKVTTNEKPIKLHRPLSCLYPLEVIPKPDTDANSPPTTDGVMKASELNDSETRTRPVREAAQKSRDQVHKWMTEQSDF